MAKIHKTLKLKYYIKSFLIKSLPTESVDKKKKKLISKLSIAEVEALKQRVDYYCKLERQQNVTFKNTVRDLKKPVTPKAYYFDTYEYARYFDENQKINYEFGDVTWIPKVPAIVKSRPISDDNQNAVLLNLDKARHFVFVENDKNFLEKKRFDDWSRCCLSGTPLQILRTIFQSSALRFGTGEQKAGKSSLAET
ncbi:hypothetical protein [uncultured Chryseobacterium sp.]|uniref:hypothetical protein n=1 Tax=uncultured Chryseobacterium sp. TaxID=259322 RepID=UPI00345BEF4A